jgi:Icc-related predicted phosphoesterase
VTVEGVKIGLLAGSMPYKGEWADEVDEEEMKVRLMALEPDCEILVSHVPPHGIMDRAYSGDRIGCQALAGSCFGYVPKFTSLKHHFFGHVHEQSGDESLLGVGYHNLSNRVMEVEI